MLSTASCRNLAIRPKAVCLVIIRHPSRSGVRGGDSSLLCAVFFFVKRLQGLGTRAYVMALHPRELP